MLSIYYYNYFYPIWKVNKDNYINTAMSDESQREEIKDEIHQLEDIEQDDSDDKEEEEEIDGKSE